MLKKEFLVLSVAIRKLVRFKIRRRVIRDIAVLTS